VTRRKRSGTSKEPLIARLLRLGILEEVGGDPERRLAWSDDFRTVIGASTPERQAAFHNAMATGEAATVLAWLRTEAATVRSERGSDGPWAGWPIARPGPQDLVASLSLGPPGEMAYWQLAVLDSFRQVGIVDAVEIDPSSGAVAIRLSVPYRRLIDAGRQPELDAGFKAALDDGPGAARAWLELEAAKLP
jgi:hypothetical protein